MEFVGKSPYRFEPSISTVLAGEPSAEFFDRLPPRQLAPHRESWRYWKAERNRPSQASLGLSVAAASAAHNRFLYSISEAPDAWFRRPEGHKLD
jgi:hypothetical protein